MSNDCTYVNILNKKKDFNDIDDNSGETIYKKITGYQINIKVEGISLKCST